MYETYERCHILHFVRLKMPDEVPFDVIRQNRLLGHEFLHVAFGKHALSRIVRLTNGLNRMKF